MNCEVECKSYLRGFPTIRVRRVIWIFCCSVRFYFRSFQAVKYQLNFTACRKRTCGKVSETCRKIINFHYYLWQNAKKRLFAGSVSTRVESIYADPRLLQNLTKFFHVFGLKYLPSQRESISRKITWITQDYVTKCLFAGLHANCFHHTFISISCLNILKQFLAEIHLYRYSLVEGLLRNSLWVVFVMKLV